MQRLLKMGELTVRIAILMVHRYQQAIDKCIGTNILCNQYQDCRFEL